AFLPPRRPPPPPVARCRAVVLLASSEPLPVARPPPVFANDRSTSELSALSLHDALPISVPAGIIVPTFPQRSPPRLLTAAACGSSEAPTSSPHSRGAPACPLQLRSAMGTGDARDTSRVGPGNFTRYPSQIRTGYSRTMRR